MKRYNTLHALYLSFYSGDFYQDVARNWKGFAFLYLFLLVAAVWIVDIVNLQKELTQWVETDAPEIVEQIPEIEITNGRAWVDIKTPYYIRDDTGAAVIAIDTSGTLRSMSDTEARVLLTSDEVIIRQSGGRSRSFSLREIEDMRIDSYFIMDVLYTVDSWFGVVIYPLAVMIAFIYRVFQVLLYGLIGLLIASAIVKTRLSFDAAVRLSVMAVTPVIIIFFLLDFADVDIPGENTVAFFIAMAFLYFGIHMKKQAEEEEPVEFFRVNE